MKLSGRLIIGEFTIEFKTHDFESSHLKLIIELSNIRSVEFCKIYNLQVQALKITSVNKHVDIFVVNEPILVRTLIWERVIDFRNKTSE